MRQGLRIIISSPTQQSKTVFFSWFQQLQRRNLPSPDLNVPIWKIEFDDIFCLSGLTRKNLMNGCKLFGNLKCKGNTKQKD